jgi:hypothetical protein
MEAFINQGLEANAAATFVFGSNSLEHNFRFVNGMASFQTNSAGIKLAANVTGTRYWVSSELNGPGRR